MFRPYIFQFQSNFDPPPRTKICNHHFCVYLWASALHEFYINNKIHLFTNYLCVYMCVCIYRTYVHHINAISIQIVWKLNWDIFTSKIRHSGTRIDDIAGIGNIEPIICMYLCVIVYFCVCTCIISILYPFRSSENSLKIYSNVKHVILC